MRLSLVFLSCDWVMCLGRVFGCWVMSIFLRRFLYRVFVSCVCAVSLRREFVSCVCVVCLYWVLVSCV